MPASSNSAATTREAEGDWGGPTEGVGAYADVNGINLYYETRGTGEPLILSAPFGVYLK